jgi:hypothetical protein
VGTIEMPTVLPMPPMYFAPMWQASTAWAYLRAIPSVLLEGAEKLEERRTAPLCGEMGCHCAEHVLLLSFGHGLCLRTRRFAYQLSLGWWSVELLELRGSSIISAARIVTPTLVFSYTRRSDHRNVDCSNHMRYQRTTHTMGTAVVGLRDQEQTKTRYRYPSLWFRPEINCFKACSNRAPRRSNCT